jgi:hypothetical protein
VDLRPEDLDPVLFQYALPPQADPAVQGGLPSESEEDRFGPLLLYYLGDEVRVDGQEVDLVRYPPVGLDRRDVRVDED